MNGISDPNVPLMETSSLVQPGRQFEFFETVEELAGFIEIPERPTMTAGYADIYCGFWTNPQGERFQVAIKQLRTIPKDRHTGPDVLKWRADMRLKREVFIWSQTTHPYLHPLFGYRSHPEPQLISPWCHHGNLTDYLRANPGLSRHDKLRLIFQIACGLEHLHSRTPPICHADIKPENVLINNRRRPALSDFGLSRVVHDLEARSGFTTSKSVRGTSIYMANELFAGQKPNLESDVYAFGGLILTVMSGKPPFDGLLDLVILRRVMLDEPPLPKDHPNLPSHDPLWKLMRRCWDKDPAARPTIREVMLELSGLKDSKPLSGLDPASDTDDRTSEQCGVGLDVQGALQDGGNCFLGGPQPNNENSRCVQNYEQTHDHAPWVSGDQEDPAFNHGANLDGSATFKESSEAPVRSGASNFGKSATQKNFVRKLYDMLDDESAQDYIRWNPDGKSFVIGNQDDFAKNVLGRYLKTGNFQVFIRQLTMYDFHKINKAVRAQRGVQAQAQQFVFSHPKFERGKPELLSEIKRKGTEQQDLPPQSETVLSGARFGPSFSQRHLPLRSSQFDHQTRILLQAESERQRVENERLKAAYEELISEHHSLKASLQVGTSVLMPRAQNEPSSTALTTDSTFFDGSASNQSFNLTENGDLFGFNYLGSPLKAAEEPVMYPQYTGLPLQSTSNNQGPSTMNTSLVPPSLDSSSFPGPSTSVRSPNISRIHQPSPQQSRTPRLWYTNLGQLFSEAEKIGGGRESR